MRHETCLACRIPGAVESDLRQMVVVAESIAPGLMHHHHTMNCGGCGRWWFDDAVIGGLGIPVPSRRDTELCPCEEGLAQYTQSIVHVPSPEAACACTKADVDRYRLPIRLGPGTPRGELPRHQEPVARARAVNEISSHVADCDAFIVSVPPDALAQVTRALRDLRGATCYLDCGFPMVIKVSSPYLREAATMARSQPPGTAMAVFIVPKTLPMRRLKKLLGTTVAIPADGSQDLLMIQTRDLFDAPALLVDAIAQHDPAWAAAVYANDLRNQS